METTPIPEGTITSHQVAYTFKEKYFQVEPENRIRRYQYFVRSLIPTILFVLFLIPFGIVMGLVMFMVSSTISAVLSALVWCGVYYLLYKIALANAVKRCHDFGNDGKIAKIIVSISFAIGIIGTFMTLLGTLGVLPTETLNNTMYQSGTLFNETVLNEETYASLAENDESLYLKIFGIIQGIAGIAGLILVLFLLFRPGNPLDNQYGKSPVNTKVSFLG